MSYTSESGRLRIIEETGAAAAALDVAMVELGEAYDHLDEHAADVMETEVFRPLQAAYGLLRRTRSEFAERHGLTVAGLPTPTPPAPQDPRSALGLAADSIERADELLSELQDSLLPVEVGDRELRTGLSETRSTLAPLPGACDSLVRGFGR